MKNNKKTNIIPILLVFILGTATFNQFDFEKLEFEKPALSIVYIIGFVVSVYLLVKKDKNQCLEREFGRAYFKIIG
jgi:hypothetical protein